MDCGRTSGVLLHVTSLPGSYGIGDLGPEAFRFADWLAAAGQHVWQVLPVGPVGYGESPYQLLSAFAGNPMLLSLDSLAEQGLLLKDEICGAPLFDERRVEFERVIPWKTKLLRRAFERFQKRSSAKNAAEDDYLVEYSNFLRADHPWLDHYATFMALKESQGNAPWWDWRSAKPRDEDIAYHTFLQFEFFRQWNSLKTHCRTLGIRLMGDLPIYIARDSADVWAHRDLFRDDVVSGVPPDYFSATGQLWGNPIYDWDRMAAHGFTWWLDRFRAALTQFSLLRLDHFRGFEAYWEVPAGEKTAVHGRWVKGPGAPFFRLLRAELGQLPIIAENLGVITPEVEALRDEFDFPGMAILQFAFGSDPQAGTFKPHNYIRNLAAYTGTHDNDTVLGWWRSEGGDSTRTPKDIQDEKARARAYLATEGCDINWAMIRMLMMSVADLVLMPLQDILGLGSEARMNTPATAGGNWRWRCPQGALTVDLAQRLRAMAEMYDRTATETTQT